MRTEVELTANLLLMDCPERGGYCYRGLENASLEISCAHAVERTACLEAVLSIQNKNASLLALICHDRSRKSCMEARERAVCDAKNVQLMWRVTTDATPKLPKRTWVNMAC